MTRKAYYLKSNKLLLTESTSETMWVNAMLVEIVLQFQCQVKVLLVGKYTSSTINVIVRIGYMLSIVQTTVTMNSEFAILKTGNYFL